MRDFQYKKEYETLLTPDIVSLLSTIHEHKGKQALFTDARSEALRSLLEVAKIQSTEASNRIEGIITTDVRLKRHAHEAKKKSPATGMCSPPSTKATTIFRRGRL